MLVYPKAAGSVQGAGVKSSALADNAVRVLDLLHEYPLLKKLFKLNRQDNLYRQA